MGRISLRKARTRKAMMRVFLRWFLYAALLVFFYACECNPMIRGYCPLLMIPLATAVAMHEGDLAAGIFGVVCGLMLDMANGVTILGFSALWLLAACPFISLLSRFFVKSNVFSHFIMNTVTVVVMAAMDMLFLHWVWEGSGAVISFQRTVLPSYGGAILFSIPIYLLIHLICVKLRPREQQRLEESAQTAEESEEIDRD